jgi:energy-coupling factor transport system permease protein
MGVFMKRDAFSGYHPAVNFIFFLCVLAFGVVILHPAFLAVGMVGAFTYYLLLHGTPGLKRIGMMLPLFLAVALLNPLINRNGQTMLFTVFSIPYTKEALIYGIVLGGMFLTMILWVNCYGTVMTGDKFTSLFGNLLPSLSLLLVMIFRMVPSLIRKGKQISGARQSVGKDFSDKKEAITVLGCLTTWALEGSIVTADSMRSRGYGTAKRTSFMIYRMTRRDWLLLTVTLFLSAAMIACVALGQTTATFTPDWFIAPISPVSLGLYGLLTLIPTLLRLQEALVWHISRSKI